MRNRTLRYLQRVLDRYCKTGLDEVERCNPRSRVISREHREAEQQNPPEHEWSDDDAVLDCWNQPAVIGKAILRRTPLDQGEARDGCLPVGQREIDTDSASCLGVVSYEHVRRAGYRWDGCRTSSRVLT